VRCEIAERDIDRCVVPDATTGGTRPNVRRTKERDMKAKVFLSGCALMALSIASAQAGPCTAEIEGLTKTIASKDAGSGPTSGAPGTHATASQAGQHPPTATMSQATQGGAASPEDVRRQTAGQPTAAQQGSTGSGGAAHPPTAAMNQATQGGAAPTTPGQHPPTAAMTQAAQGQTAPAGNVGRQAGASEASMEASAALDRARDLDKQGKEADCMQAVQQAKHHPGSR
jgi:hypothetical protein